MKYLLTTCVSVLVLFILNGCGTSLLDGSVGALGVNLNAPDHTIAFDGTNLIITYKRDDGGTSAVVNVDTTSANVAEGVSLIGADFDNAVSIQLDPAQSITATQTTGIGSNFIAFNKLKGFNSGDKIKGSFLVGYSSTGSNNFDLSGSFNNKIE